MVTVSLAGWVLAAGTVVGQDGCPLRDCHVWQPMTGVTERQMDEALAAGYDTMLLKIHPPLTADGRGIDPGPFDETIGQATRRGFKLILAILGWVGLGRGRFWDTDESGAKIPDRLDPFWPAAMRQVEWYFAAVIDHYRSHPRIVAFAPTWGIYGEAGFTSWKAGRSKHALARFNEWRKQQGLPVLDALPTRKAGPNTEFNRFIRFRYLYVQQVFDAMVRRLKTRAGSVPVGMWQELYPVAGYLWNMVEIPSADFALYEACFPYQTTHHPEKTLAETMGFRYRCASAEDYRDYFLPLLARKRGEGQRFMGCQLSNSYAKHYGWSEQKAEQLGFDRWEDAFSPYLKALLDAPLESPRRDVLLVFPTYAAATLSDHPCHAADVKFIDVLLRMFGCQMVRYGSLQLDGLSVEQMNRFRLIVVPCAAYLIPETYEKLKATSATVVLTGCFGQAYDARFVPFGGERRLDGLDLRYIRRAPGRVGVCLEHALTKGLREQLARQAVTLARDEAFAYIGDVPGVKVLLRCGRWPLLSTRYAGRWILIHGHLFAAASYDPARRSQNLSGSKDASANEHDPWGHYSSTNPQNTFGRLLIRNILDHAKVAYRVPAPKPRTRTRFLGDHMEQASISANIAYNNTSQAQNLTLRLPYRPRGYEARAIAGGYEVQITIPPFSYVALQPAAEAPASAPAGPRR